MSITAAPSVAHAQNIVSVPFTRGFIGTVGANAQNANSVSTFTTLGISRIFFIQNSVTNEFQLQGNDLSGTLRIVGTLGNTLDVPANAVWRQSPGGNTSLIGFIPTNAQARTWTSGATSLSISTTTNIGGYLANYAGPYATDGTNQSGNAASASLMLGTLNSYLTTVVSARPAGPVTVTGLSTSSTQPTITGTATLQAGESFSIIINGTQYTTSSSPAVVFNGTSWSLALTSTLAVGIYEVMATISNADGFTLSDATSNELVITAPATPLTIGGSFTASDKAYNGTTAASGNTGGLTLSGVLPGHTVTIASVTLAFQSAAVGTGKTVTITGVTLGGAHAASYSVDLTGSPTATAAITEKMLTIGGSFTAANKVFDNSTSATIVSNALTLVGVVGTDAVSLTGLTVAFGSASPGTGKTVSITSASLTGAAAGNYTLDLTGAPTTTANITNSALTLGGSFTANDRAYNGLLGATGNTAGLTLVGVQNGHAVQIAAVSLAFQTAAVATGKTVTITGVTLSGADAALYAVDLTGAPTATAAITTRTLTIGGSFVASNKQYDGTATATFGTTALTLVNTVSGDDVSLTGVTIAFADAAIGTAKSVTISTASLSGTAAGNYTLSTAGAPTSSANITAQWVSIGGSFTANDKPFDGTTAATGNTAGLSLSGVQPGHTVSIASVTLAFQSAAVGTGKTVEITNVTLTGPHASYYAVTLNCAPTATASITVANTVLTVSGTLSAQHKVYDGTTTATGSVAGLTLVGVQNGHTVTITGATLAFDTAPVGTGKTVRIASLTLGGAHASSYTVNLAPAPTTTANITPRALGITGLLSSTRVFDGTTAAPLTGQASYSNLAPGEVFAVVGTPVGRFDSPSVGYNKLITITGIAAPTANYTVHGVHAAVGGIMPRPLTLGGTFTVSDKIFDGNVDATITSQALTFIGRIGSDALALTDLVAEFESPVVGAARRVLLRNATLTGAAAGNYTLSLSGAPSSTARIIPATPPGAPRTLQGLAGDGAISLTWQLPEDPGCSAISGWIVEVSTNGGGTWTRRATPAASALAHTVNALVNNQGVLLRTAAMNSCGTGAFAVVGPLVPMGPTRTTDNTRPITVPTGGTSVHSGTGTRPVTTAVHDSTQLRLTGENFSLTVESLDDSIRAIPVDTPTTLAFEQGGHAASRGTGFAPATVVTLYLVNPTQSLLLGTVVVEPQGTFDTRVAIPATMAPGAYTLQVIGLDRELAPRTASLGVLVDEPPPELVLTATPDQTTPAVGDTVRFTLEVTNLGRGAANDVRIPRAFREAGFTVLSTAPVHGRYDATTDTWIIARIEAGARARLLLTTIVTPPITEVPVR